MSAAIATNLRVYAGQRWPTMNHKWRKARLASLLGMNERRVKSLYEAEETARLRADEETRIKALLGQQEEVNATEDKALAARLAELEAQVAFLLAALAGDELAAQGQAARAARKPAHSRGPSMHGRRAADHH